jgi:hypothetical protein
VGGFSCCCEEHRHVPVAIAAEEVCEVLLVFDGVQQYVLSNAVAAHRHVDLTPWLMLCSTKRNASM